ncbi:hypothetical protein SNF32_17180, partial [Enterococcus mundtii]|nr:hypothetical protein [Enterococcus mundtii]
GMLVLGTTILILHAFLLPVGIVYAETTEKKEAGQIQKEEQLELPTMKNYLEVEEESEPRFYFPHSRLQGTVEAPLKVTFSQIKRCQRQGLLFRRKQSWEKISYKLGLPSIKKKNQVNG